MGRLGSATFSPCSDIRRQKAFLQIRIKEDERDALRFHWRTNEHSNLETLRFTRALFGLTCSPFLLGGVIEQHLQSWESKLPEVVAALRKSLYVNDLLNGRQTAEEARKRKSTAIEVFGDAKFVLHKWNSNVAELEETHEFLIKNQSNQHTYSYLHFLYSVTLTKVSTCRKTICIVYSFILVIQTSSYQGRG